MDASSKRAAKQEAKQALKDLESLRNHRVHAQDIVSHDGVQIIRTTQRGRVGCGLSQRSRVGCGLTPSIGLSACDERAWAK